LSADCTDCADCQAEINSAGANYLSVGVFISFRADFLFGDCVVIDCFALVVYKEEPDIVFGDGA
jgi:hypothetical protein